MLFELGNDATEKQQNSAIFSNWRTSTLTSSLLANSLSVCPCVTQPAGKHFFDHQPDDIVYGVASINEDKENHLSLIFLSLSGEHISAGLTCLAKEFKLAVWWQAGTRSLISQRAV